MTIDWFGTGLWCFLGLVTAGLTSLIELVEDEVERKVGMGICFLALLVPLAFVFHGFSVWDIRESWLAYSAGYSLCWIMRSGDDHSKKASSC
jgi:hypothetical protein